MGADSADRMYQELTDVKMLKNILEDVSSSKYVLDVVDYVVDVDSFLRIYLIGNSQLQLSLELRNCFPYVRMMPLTLANSYQITSILHMVLSTVTVSVFIEKFNFWAWGAGSPGGRAN